MPTDTAAWTIDQLTERVADALSADYAGQASGRVREVPNIRTIRWYTTIGLLDRPAEMRGRTALYGRRHLAQIVAIKRLQAAGRSLTEVQEQLIGADDATLFRIAELAETADIAELDTPPAAVRRAAAPNTDDARSRFWSAAPSAAPKAAPAPTTSPSPKTAPAPAPAPLVHGVRLSADVTLLLAGPGRAPDAAARRAIEEAARPLLDELRRLGLAEN